MASPSPTPMTTSSAARDAGVAILLTPPGSGAIAVIRATGRGVLPFLQQHFSKSIQPNHCTHGKLTDNETEIDDPVVVFDADENVADINLHGSPWIVHQVLDLLRRHNFEIKTALASPFPLEATNGRTEIDREIEQYLPIAKTELALRILLNQRTAWQTLLRRVEQRTITRDEIARIANDQSLVNLLRLPTIAIIGAPNVGKSTLANQLFAQERSITADLPGTTRDWVGEIANIDGLAVTLIDTPGHRTTTDEIERAAIDTSQQVIRAADLVIHLLDATRNLSDQQFPQHEQPAITVANKTDLPLKWNPQDQKALPIVATTGAGLGDLRRAILAHFQCESLDLKAVRPWTPRHRALLQQLSTTL